MHDRKRGDVDALGPGRTGSGPTESTRERCREPADAGAARFRVRTGCASQADATAPEALVALRESEERFRIVTHATSELITETDAEGRVVYASQTCEDVLGYTPEALIGTTPIPLLLHPDDAERAAGAFLDGIEREGPSRSVAYRMRHRNGAWRWYESIGVPYRRTDGELRMIAITRDITETRESERERREHEARSQQTRKLESLGVMAAGIAHDFNNLLTPILGDTSLVLMDLPEDSPLREHLHRVQRAASRAAALTNQMLAYAGKRPLLVEPTNVSQLVLEMSQLVDSAVTSKAVVAYELSSDVPTVHADTAQLSQVVLNLVANASEAIGERSGRIEIRTGVADAQRVARRATLFGADLHEGPCATIEVADNGSGMDAETQSRSFDPFFTTRFTGRGLGLAAVLGIVRGHEGAIELLSEPGRGTRVRVILPAAPVERRDSASGAGVGRGPGSGTLLVVDDDEGVRDLARHVLLRAGFSVRCAASAEEALELFRARAGEIDLVLLDRTLPATSGEEVYDALRRVRPDVRVVLISGYGEDTAAARFADRDLAGFLQKPFLPEALVDQVRSVLEKER